MINLTQIEWSAELQEKLKGLPPRHARIITGLVTAEAQGVPIGRLLRATYSCPWCGSHARTKADRAKHQAKCKRRGQPWQFVSSDKQFYHLRATPKFRECLELARLETHLAALDQARRLLLINAPKAARELGRQITEGERDTDRRTAAVAILDRIGLETEPPLTDRVQTTQLASLLRELRDLGNEEDEELNAA